MEIEELGISEAELERWVEYLRQSNVPETQAKAIIYFHDRCKELEEKMKRDQILISEEDMNDILHRVDKIKRIVCTCTGQATGEHEPNCPMSKEYVVWY